MNSESPKEHTILAIDTSVDLLGIAVESCTGTTLSQVSLGLKHGELLATETYHQLELHNLKVKDLDYIICSRGPGSFTGLRIGISFAKGLSAPWNIPLVGISYLDAIHHEAQKLFPHDTNLVVIDGRKNRYYWSLSIGGKHIQNGDNTALEIMEILINTRENGKQWNVYLFGPDKHRFANEIRKQSNSKDPFILIEPTHHQPIVSSMIELGKQSFVLKKFLKDNEGPEYFRPSQAEET